MAFRHSSGCKIRSAGDNVDELGRSAVVREAGMNGWGGPEEREPRIQGAESVQQLRRGEVVIDFQTEGEGRGRCGAGTVETLRVSS